MSEINHPEHCNAGNIECIDAIRSALTFEEFAGFCKGNIIKYVWREMEKGGTDDLKKADWYLNALISNRKAMELARELGATLDGKEVG